jgi:hypothetical protein
MVGIGPSISAAQAIYAIMSRLAGYTARLNPTDKQWKMFSEHAFTCPTVYTTQYREKNGVPTWCNRYHGDWDNLRLYNSSAGLDSYGSGAYHGSDVKHGLRHC